VFQTNEFFEAVLEKELDMPVKVLQTEHTSGGCINHTLRLTTSEGVFFLKWQDSIPDDMFEKEAKGLGLLAASGTIKIPEVIGHGKWKNRNYLLLEYIEGSSMLNKYWEDFGASLAQMHRQNTQSTYGLDHKNYIGKLPQPNDFQDDWINFLIKERFEFQLKLAIDRDLLDNKFIDRYRRFYDLLPNLLPVARPALIHGDMWSGNVMVGADGKVCLIDPAVYYGHREIELAFTQMFGGFSRAFYDSYHDAYPLEPGFEERVAIYNIYPHMVHVNLFGTSYLSGVESVLSRYL